VARAAGSTARCMGCRARRSAGGPGGWIGRGPAAHFLPVEIAEVPDRDAGGAVPVEARIEIALPDGVRVRVGRGVDGLRRVLAALGR
jgi:hypothetical protein